MAQHDLPIVPEAIRQIADSTDRKLAWQFFVFFSRFEYALKKDPRYLMSGAGDAKANWDLFASNGNEKFDPAATRQLVEAVDYFKASPPRKQTRNFGQLGWSEPLMHNSREPLLIWLLLCVRTVRNNLFHGGKFPKSAVPDPSRDHTLIEHSLVILSHALRLDPRVEQAFGDGLHL
jgi:hypothetical protein